MRSWPVTAPGNYATVQAAVDAAPAARTTPWVIAIKSGRYDEHVVVPVQKPFLVFRGDETGGTVITHHRNFNTPKPDGSKFTTPESATVLIQGTDFTAENIAFENTTTLEEHVQALAFYTTGDRGVFRRCRFLGWQDTLRADSPLTRCRQRAGRSAPPKATRASTSSTATSRAMWTSSTRPCTAVFDRCHIHCLADGYITAASTPEAAPWLCLPRLQSHDRPQGRQGHVPRPAVEKIRRDRVYPHRARGHCSRGRLGQLAQPGQRADDALRGIRQHRPWAKPAERVKWAKQLTDEEAKTYTVENILRGKDGWNPAQ